MEAGLLRDIDTHKITTPEHWALLMMPTVYGKIEVSYDLIMGDQVVTPSYAPHCVNDVSAGCHPVLVSFAEHLVETDTGPAEARKIAQLLETSTGFSDDLSDDLIEEEAWEYI